MAFSATPFRVVGIDAGRQVVQKAISDNTGQSVQAYQAKLNEIYGGDASGYINMHGRVVIDGQATDGVAGLKMYIQAATGENESSDVLAQVDNENTRSIFKIAGNGDVTIGNSTDGGDLVVYGTQTFVGGTTFEGNVDLGNEASDTVSFVGVVDTNVIPDAAGSRNLGSTAAEWGSLYLGDGTSLYVGLDQDVSAGWNNASSQFDLDVAGKLDIDATGAIDIRADEASVLSVDKTGAGGTTLTIETLTSGDLDITSAGDMTLTATDGITVASATTVNADLGISTGGDITFARSGTADGTFTLPQTGTGTTGSLRVNGSNELQWWNGSSWSTAGTSGSENLQQTYEQGSTISTNSTGGDLQVTVTTDGDFDIINGADSFTFDYSAADALNVTGVIAAMDVDASGAITLDAAAASNFTVVGGDLTLSTTTSGELDLTSAGLMDVNAGANLDIDVTGTYTMDSTGTFAVKSTSTSQSSIGVFANGSLKIYTGADPGGGSQAGDIDIVCDGHGGSIDIDAGAGVLPTEDGGNVTINSGVSVFGTAGFVAINSAAELDLTSTGLMDFNAGANLDIDVTGTFDMLSTGAFSVDGTGASNVTATSGTLTISTVTSGDLDLTAAGDVDMDGTNVTIDASSGVSIDAAAASNFSVAGGDLTLATTTSGELDLTSAGLMDVNAGANLDVDVTGNFTMDSTGTFSIDGVGNSNVSVSTGDLTFATTGSTSDVKIDSAGQAMIDAADQITIATDAVDSADSANIILQTGNVTTSGSSGIIKLRVGTGQTFEGSIDFEHGATTVAKYLMGSEVFDYRTSLGADTDWLFKLPDTDNASVGAIGAIMVNAAGDLMWHNGTAWQTAGTSSSDTLQDAYEAGSSISTNATGSDLQVTVTSNGDFDIVNGADSFTFDYSAADALNVTGVVAAMDVDASGAITFDAAAASNFTVDSANLTLETTTSGDVIMQSDGDVRIVDGWIIEAKYPAFESISAGDAVVLYYDSGDTRVEVAKADNNNTAYSGEFYGIAYAAAAAGNTVSVIIYGADITVTAAQVWDASDFGKPCYLGSTAGQLTDTAPTSGPDTWVTRAGIVVAAGKINLSPAAPIELY